ncbi:MAG: hypothetical protein M1828_003134 [Chrysothrix sp. TS-e1954]|nr:MAG: hypothetical protein M1828_003134 [Chrysothrix sp. TS-e1954]
MASTPQDVFPSRNPQYARFPSRRSVVHSTKGIVSCTEPLAARAGIRILEQGGNAADAAVATAAAMNITEPCMTGIGGDMFCLFYNAKTKKTHALNGSGRAGSKVSLAGIRKDLRIPEDQPGEIPPESVHAVTIPGAAAGWIDTCEKFGNGKLSMEQILKPAIELGEEGYPVSQVTSVLWQNSETIIKQASPNFAEMLKADSKARDGCRAPGPGEIFTNKTLANTFRLLAKHGKKGFYEGEVANAYVKVVQDLGGHLSLEDLKKHGDMGSEEVDAISLKFDGQGIKNPIELWEHPPNGQGLIALMALGMLQELEKANKIPTFTEKDHNNINYLHALIEVLRLAFSDGTWFITDPNVEKVPVQDMLSPSYLSKRSSAFSKDNTIKDIKHGSPAASASDTVYFSVTDPSGNACSFINSNYGGFGTAIIPKGCGFTLQNRGANFVLGPADHPNIFAPSKRPYHTIIPGMVTNQSDGSLHTCFGVMGGFMQPQGHVQVLLNMLVFGMDPQEALDAPRICMEMADQSGESSADTDMVYIEHGISEDVVKGLEKLGHRVTVLEGFQRGKFGRGQIVRRSVEDGRLVWSAGSDPRADGHASPL